MSSSLFSTTNNASKIPSKNPYQTSIYTSRFGQYQHESSNPYLKMNNLNQVNIQIAPKNPVFNQNYIQKGPQSYPPNQTITQEVSNIISLISTNNSLDDNVRSALVESLHKNLPFTYSEEDIKATLKDTIVRAGLSQFRNKYHNPSNNSTSIDQNNTVPIQLPINKNKFYKSRNYNPLYNKFYDENKSSQYSPKNLVNTYNSQSYDLPIPQSVNSNSNLTKKSQKISDKKKLLSQFNKEINSKINNIGDNKNIYPVNTTFIPQNCQKWAICWKTQDGCFLQKSLNDYNSAGPVELFIKSYINNNSDEKSDELNLQESNENQVLINNYLKTDLPGVAFDASRKCWRVGWISPNDSTALRRCRYFNINRYGCIGAKQLAIKFKNQANKGAKEIDLEDIPITLSEQDLVQEQILQKLVEKFSKKRKKTEYLEYV